jgi:predicted peptidase
MQSAPYVKHGLTSRLKKNNPKKASEARFTPQQEAQSFAVQTSMPIDYAFSSKVLLETVLERTATPEIHR